MFPSYQNNSLPVSADRVDQSNWFNGAPRNIPCNPGAQVSHQFQEAVPMIVGLLVNHIQNQVNRNHLRVFMYNMVSQNQWQNELFAEIVNATAVWAEWEVSKNRYSNVDRVVEEVVTNICSIYTAILASQFQQLTNGLGQNERNEINARLQQFNDIRNEMTRGQNQGYGNQSYGNQGGFNYNGGFNNNQGQVNQVNHGLASAGSSLLGRFSNTPAGEDNGFRSSLAPRTDTPREEPNSIHLGGARPEVKSRQEAPSAMTREKSYVELTNLVNSDSQVAVAHETDWRRTPTHENPYPVVYDPQVDLMLYERSPNNQVREVLATRDGSMEYTDHELNPDLAVRARQAARSNQGRIAPNYTIFDKAISSDAEIELSEHDIDVPRTVTIPKTLFAFSTEQALLKAKMEVLSNQLNMLGGATAIEFDYVHMKPIMTSGEAVEQTRLILDLLDSRGIRSLSEKLRYGQQSDTPLSPEVFTYVDKQLTERFLSMLHINLGISKEYHIDSFAEDADEMMDGLVEDFGTDVTDMLNRNVTTLLASIAVVSNEQRDLQLKALTGEYEFSEEDRATIESRTVLFGQRIHMAVVPWASSDMSINMREAGAMVLEHRTPGLHECVSVIAEKSKANGRIPYSVVMRTTDGVMFDIANGFHIEGSRLLSIK